MSTKIKVVGGMQAVGYTVMILDGAQLSLNGDYYVEKAHTHGKFCYECNFETVHLSPRGRCLKCEYKRSLANEAENEKLREQLEAYMNCVIEGKHNKFTAPWGTYGPNADKYQVKKLIDLASDHLLAILDTEA